MIYLKLFIKFFQIGLFSFGGGYSTIPFLYEIADSQRWYSIKQLTDMIAISSLTPGPVGINVATFAGILTSGIFGAIIATGAIVLPSYILASIIFKMIDKFKNSKIISGAIRALKPTGCALLTSVFFKLILNSNLHLLGTLALIFFIITSFWKKLSPAHYLGISALFGLITGYFNWIGA